MFLELADGGLQGSGSVDMSVFTGASGYRLEVAAGSTNGRSARDLSYASRGSCERAKRENAQDELAAAVVKKDMDSVRCGKCGEEFNVWYWEPCLSAGCEDSIAR